MTSPTIEIYRSKRNNKWYAKLIGRNGHSIKWGSRGGKSNGYVKRSECIKQAQNAKRDFADAKINVTNPNGSAYTTR